MERLVERLVEWTIVEVGGAADRMDSNGAAEIGIVDLAAIGTVLKEHTFNMASSKI